MIDPLFLAYFRGQKALGSKNALGSLTQQNPIPVMRKGTSQGHKLVSGGTGQRLEVPTKTVTDPGPGMGSQDLFWGGHPVFSKN